MVEDLNKALVKLLELYDRNQVKKNYLATIFVILNTITHIALAAAICLCLN